MIARATTTLLPPSRPAHLLLASRSCVSASLPHRTASSTVRRAARTVAEAQAPLRPETQSQQPLRRCSVAVIGAGAAGLVAARELLREGHAVRVFEQGSTVGGVWQYSEEVEGDDLLGRNPARGKKVHSSMYRNLRTNLPREIMGYSDFPFTPRMMGESRSVDPRRFCSHVEVLHYLQAFSDYFSLESVISFNMSVERVTPICHPAPGGGPEPAEPGEGKGHGSGLPLRWRVQVQAQDAGGSGAGDVVEEDFDAVVVCNGHYSEPRTPQVQGGALFPGLQMHSHNYRGPEAFRGQRVLVVGASNSGEDISREVAEVAQAVYLSARTWREEPLAQAYGPRGNIYRYPMVSALTPGGHATFPSPSPSTPTTSPPPATSLPIDAVIYATGYHYTFPFLLDQNQGQGQQQQQQQNQGQGQEQDEARPSAPLPPPSSSSPSSPGLPLSVSSVLSVEEQCVGPLYMHMFPPSLAPGLSFLGLPWKVVPFPQAEVQAKLVARVLSGRSVLPDEQYMLEAVHELYLGLHQRAVPRRYTHMQNQEQWQYNDELARMCGTDVGSTPDWRVQMYTETGLLKRSAPETYRDGPFSPKDQQLLQAAHSALDHMAQKLWTQQPAWSCSSGGQNKEQSSGGQNKEQSTEPPPQQSRM